MTESTLETGRTATSPQTRVRVGLVLAILLGLANFPFLFTPTPDGEEGPPYGVLVFSAIVGLVSIATAVMAWRSGNRLILRITAACVIINAITSLPAFFVDVSAGIKLAVCVTILASIASAILTMSRPRTV